MGKQTLAVALGAVATMALIGAVLVDAHPGAQAALVHAGDEAKATAEAASGRIGGGAASEARAAAAIPQIRAALRAGVDAATLEDLFASEDWWLPYRDHAVAITNAGGVLVARAAGDVPAQTGLAPRALASDVATMVKKTGHGLVIAAAAVVDGVAGAPVLTLARPVDAGVLADWARAAGVPLALTDGEALVLASDGFVGPAALAGHETEPGGVTDGAHLAAAARLDEGVWLWAQRQAPPLPQGYRWILLLLAALSAAGAGATLLAGGRAHRPAPPPRLGRTEAGVPLEGAEPVPRTIGGTQSGPIPVIPMGLAHSGSDRLAVRRAVANAETLIVRERQTFGRYELIEHIGEGGMSDVYLASMRGAEGFQRTLVVKRLKPALAQTRAAVDQFIDEARLGSLLTHPNIVQVFDFGMVDDGYYMALEYISGRNIAQIVRRHVERSGAPLGVSTVFYLAHEVLQALDYAHGRADGSGEPLGIVHRDVSPANILVSAGGDVKLIDFGIVKAESRLSRTNVGNIKGNPAFMAPEQARGQPVDARSDLFSLGLVMYYALTGHVPYGGPSPGAAMYQAALGLGPEHMQRVHALPGAAGRVIARALCVDAAERFQTAQDFADAIEPELALGSRSAMASLLEVLFAGDAAGEAGRSWPSAG